MDCCVNKNVNNYANSGGGGMTMKKKYAHKFNKNSSNSQFSLNGRNSHNIFGYIGNPNSSISYDGCKKSDSGSNVQTSVKNTKAYLNNKLNCNINSLACYKKINHELVKRYEDNYQGTPLNKHLTANNNDQSTRISMLKAKCSIDRTNYVIDISGTGNTGKNNCSDFKTQNATSTNRTQYLARQCNITKDKNEINGFTPGYDIYYNDSTLFKKIQCQNNPPDAKIIAC